MIFNKIKQQIGLLARLMGYAIRIRPDAIFITGLGTVSSVLEVAGLAILLPLTSLAAHQPMAEDSYWKHLPALFGSQPDAHFYILAFLSMLLLRTVTQVAATILTHHLNRQLNGIFSIRALDAFVQHLSFAQVQKESIGHFVSVAGEEAVRAAAIVASVVRLVPLLILFALYFAMITYQSWQAGVSIVLFTLFVLGCLWGAFKKSHQLGHLAQLQSREAGTHFIETLSGLRTVRSFNAEPYVTTRYAEMTRTYKRTLFLVDSINSAGGAVPPLFLTTAMLVSTLFLISPALLVTLLPTIMVGIMMVLRLLPLTSQTLDVALRLASDLKAAESVSEMLNAVQSRDGDPHPKGENLTDAIHVIEFDRVSFRYSENMPPVLDDFSATFRSGKSYAISGPSGVGKSTIVDLLLKFYAAQRGEIRINGKDIDTIANASLRNRIVLAEQAVRIFYDTIARNVSFGSNKNEPDIDEALRLVGLQEFLQSLPDGNRTLMAFQGGNISGGQRQRLGLARALLRQADVLIMDESTSALDYETREKVLSSIFPRYRDKILIFIAHDAAILERVDEVIYLSPPEVEPTMKAAIS